MSRRPSPQEPRRERLAAAWPGLSADARLLLTAVALHQQPVPQALWAALAEPAQAADELEQAALVEESAEGYTPVADAAAEAIRRLAPWSMRRRAHALLATHLARTPSTLERAARHAEAAGQPDDAGRLWLAAARGACRAHRHADASTAFVEALRLLPATLPEDELTQAVTEFGRCASLAGDPSPAIALLQAWLDRPGWRAHLRFRAEALLVRADLEARVLRHVDAAETRRLAARELDQLGRTEEAATAACAAAVGLAYALRFRAGREAAAEAVGFARRARRPEIEARAITIGGLVRGMQGQTREGLAEVEAALDLALKHRLTGPAAEAYHLLGNVHDYASCYRDEAAAVSVALIYCRRHGEEQRGQLCLGCLGYAQVRSGQWKRAEATLARVLGDRSADPVARAIAQGVQALLHIHRGELRPARNLALRSLEASRRFGLVSMELIDGTVLALHAEGTGEATEAGRIYRELLELWRGTEDRHDAIPALTAASVFFAGQGDASGAAEFAEALQRIASASANPEAVGAAALASGELKLLAGNAAAAAREFESSIFHYNLRELSLEQVRARLRLAAALLRADERGRALVVLEEARRHALRLGARPLAAAAAPPHTAAPGPAGPWELLSARQRDVARLLVSGHTNKEMAATLGVSVRTVDMHVAHLLGRLDCRTRAEAAAKLSASAS